METKPQKDTNLQMAFALAILSILLAWISISENMQRSLG